MTFTLALRFVMGDCLLSMLNFIEFSSGKKIKFLRKTAATLLPVDQNYSLRCQIKLTGVENCTQLQNFTSKFSTDQN